MAKKVIKRRIPGRKNAGRNIWKRKNSDIIFFRKAADGTIIL